MFRLITTTLALSLLIAGCAEPEPSGPSGPDVQEETETYLDPDGPPPVDLDVEPIPVQDLTPLTFVVDSDRTDLIVRVSEYASEASITTVRVEGGLATAHMVQPRDEAFVDMPDGSMRMAVYSVSLIVDENGNGEVDRGETLLGLNPYNLAYITDLDAQTREWFDPGFIALDTETLYPLSALPLSDNLSPAEVTLSGTNAAPEAYGRLAVIPDSYFDDPEVGTLADIAALERWSLSLSGEPPESHLSSMDEFRGVYLEFIAAYPDTGGDGPGTDVDGWTPICHPEDGEPLLAAYLPVPADLLEAVGYIDRGVRPGWQVGPGEALFGDVHAPLAGDDLTELVIDPDLCDLD